MSKNSGVKGKTIPQLHRAQAAEVRKRARGSRSVDEQIALINARPGKSAKEISALREYYDNICTADELRDAEEPE